MPRILGQGRALKGLVDHRAEVPAVDVLDAGPGHQTPGVEAVGVGFSRFLDAVGVEDDGTGELGKFLGLILPCPAVVANQMAVFFQAGIAVSWQHLAMGINIDALAFSLLEDLFHHLEIVAGYQDGSRGFGAQLNRSRNRGVRRYQCERYSADP